MLSEDELKAIQMLEKFTTEHKMFNIKHSDGLEKNIDIVLNLITKQSNILNKVEEYAKGMNDKELLLILKSNEIDELINKCEEEGLINE